MKIIPQSKRFSFPTIHINRDDIESILEILRSKGAEINLECEGYQFDSIDEICERLGNSVKIFSISAKKPYVSIEFKKNPLSQIDLYASGDDSSGIAAFHEIKELLLKRKSILVKILPIQVAAIPFLIFLFIGFVPLNYIATIFPSKFFSLCFFSLFIMLGLFPLAFKFGQFYTISLLHSHENKSFLYRKKDDIMLIILGAIIGAVATILFGKLF